MEKQAWTGIDSISKALGFRLCGFYSVKTAFQASGPASKNICHREPLAWKRRMQKNPFACCNYYCQIAFFKTETVKKIKSGYSWLQSWTTGSPQNLIGNEMRLLSPSLRNILASSTILQGRRSLDSPFHPRTIWDTRITRNGGKAQERRSILLRFRTSRCCRSLLMWNRGPFSSQIKAPSHPRLHVCA